MRRFVGKVALVAAGIGPPAAAIALSEGTIRVGVTPSLYDCPQAPFEAGRTPERDQSDLKGEQRVTHVAAVETQVIQFHPRCVLNGFAHFVRHMGVVTVLLQFGQRSAYTVQLQVVPPCTSSYDYSIGGSS